jgi:hypothetical protein
MKAIVRKTVQNQKETNLLASPAHFEYLPRYDDEGDLRVVMLRLQVDAVEVVVEEPGTVTSLVMIVMYLLRLSHICEG